MGLWQSAGFVTYELRFTLPGSALATDPATGNPVPGEGPSYVLRAMLRETRNPVVREYLALSPEERALEGYLDTPKTFPDGVVPGLECALTYGGRAGTFRLAPARAHTLRAVADALGARVLGVWKAV